jgi:cytochrome P450
VLADPYPVLARLRDESPAFWHEQMGTWCLTRYADCTAVLRDHRRFARDRRRAGAGVSGAALSVQSLDPPEQSAIRGLFVNAVRAQDLSGIERRAAARLTALLPALQGRAEFDVMTEIAAPLAASAVCDVLGVREPDPGSFAAVSDAIMRSMDAGLVPAARAAGEAAREELSALVGSWFDGAPGPGVLAHVREHAGSLPAGAEPYLRNTARVMFQGGYSTVTAAAGNCAGVLLDHPDALEPMRDPAVLGTGAEELARYDGPVQATSRTALEDIDFGGVTVRAGQVVTVLLAAANRDPAQFPEPGRLLLAREPNRHLGYGWGTHSCIGAAPTRAVLRALVRVLLDQPAPLRAAGPARRRRTATMRAFEALPATFRP